MTIRNLSIIFAVFLMTQAPSASGQTIIYVDGSVSSSGDGTNWATAKKTMQEGIDAATQNQDPADQVWVRSGSYTVTTSIQLQEGVKVFGGFAGTEDPMTFDPEFDARDFENNETVLTGELGDPDDFDDNVEVLAIAPENDSDFIFDGFTITRANHHGVKAANGANGTFRNLLIIDNEANEPAEPFGAGASVSGASPSFLSCRFENNRCDQFFAAGGAMAADGGSVVSVSDCKFIGNEIADSVSADAGGAVWTSFAVMNLTRCHFSGNRAINGDGGAVGQFFGSYILIDCTFTDNAIITDETFYRGGSCNFIGATAVVINCRFDGNMIWNDADALRGAGGALAMSKHGIMVNSLFTDNAAATGGAIVCDGSDSLISNCTVFGNHASGNGGGLTVVASPASPPVFANCIFWGNLRNWDTFNESDDEDAQVWANQMATNRVRVRFSNIQNLVPSGDYDNTNDHDNINDDPLFVSITTGDLRLSTGSPCIDSGNNADVVPDITDMDMDGSNDEPTPLDVALRPRFVAGGLVPGQVNACDGVVDMGAHEFAYGCDDCIRMGDMNYDSLVDGEDIQPFVDCALDGDGGAE